MADYHLLKDITAGLRRLLEEEFQKARISLEIVTKPPPDSGPNSDKKVSLWLYQITENEFVKNQPMVRSSTAGGGNSTPPHVANFPPLALNLYFLLTPLADLGDRDQELLGKSMEVFYDNAIFVIRASDQSLNEVRISLCSMNLEELTRVWDALRQPYRLSVCYQVRVAKISSARQQSNARIVDQSTAAGTTPAIANGN